MRIAIAAATILLSACMLFARLGRYALWDDEAITALTLRGVWQTGDTSAVHGHNLLLYRNGLLLHDMRDRGTPPLQFYVAAPFLGLMGDTALAARIPFALMGLACIGLIFWWLWRDQADVFTWLLVALAIVSNVSLMLYFRQCRYYGLTTLLAVAVAYAYLHVRTRRGLIGFSMLLLLLLASNYMTFAAVCAGLGLDYFLWGRKRRWMGATDWTITLAPVALLGAAIVWVWNPLKIAEPGNPDLTWIGSRSTLLWWNLRDLNVCEFLPGLLLLAAPVIGVLRRDQWLIRAVVALAIAIVVTTVISPQEPGRTGVADIRYLCWTIPLCIAIAVLVLRQVAQWSKLLALSLAVFAFGSNLFNPQRQWKVRSTPFLFARELIFPRPDSITPVVEWLSKQARQDQTVVVMPPFFAYPLMFHEPKLIYAWQINPPIPPRYEKLDPIHIRGLLPPDYIVTYGPRGLAGAQKMKLDTPYPVQYEPVENIDVLFDQVQRPELFWHSFGVIPKYDPKTAGVTIFKRRF